MQNFRILGRSLFHLQILEWFTIRRFWRSLAEKSMRHKWVQNFGFGPKHAACVWVSIIYGWDGGANCIPQFPCSTAQRPITSLPLLLWHRYMCECVCVFSALRSIYRCFFSYPFFFFFVTFVYYISENMYCDMVSKMYSTFLDTRTGSVNSSGSSSNSKSTPTTLIRILWNG